jgi:ribosomal protein S18 acetylase RimI-like enzyme
MIDVLDLTNQTDLNRLKIFSMLEHPFTFRYFKNRIFEEAIKSHQLTLLYQNEEKKDVGYAHIDFDNKSQRFFFGICILAEYQNKGIGNILLKFSIDSFNRPLYLTVDNNNTTAINLYRKFNFTKIENCGTYSLWSHIN